MMSVCACVLNPDVEKKMLCCTYFFKASIFYFTQQKKLWRRSPLFFSPPGSAFKPKSLNFSECFFRHSKKNPGKRGMNTWSRSEAAAHSSIIFAECCIIIITFLTFLCTINTIYGVQWSWWATCWYSMDIGCSVNILTTLFPHQPSG